MTALIPLGPIKSLKLELEERISIDEDAIAFRDEMLANVEKAVPALITCPAEQLAGRNNAIELKNWLAEVESRMEEINSELLPLQRRARRLTDEASAPVEKLLKAIKMRLTGFDVREEERVKKEEAERQKKIQEAQAETDRLAREADAAQRKIWEAKIEAKRLQEAAERQAADAKNAKERQAAKLAAKQAEAAASAISQDEAEQAARAEMQAYQAKEQERQAMLVPVPEASKQTGLVRKKNKKWKLAESPDAIHRLYAANRSLVRLGPNAAAINAIVFPEACPDGLECWWERGTELRGS